jgi:hypothetical protein
MPTTLRPDENPQIPSIPEQENTKSDFISALLKPVTLKPELPTTPTPRLTGITQDIKAAQEKDNIFATLWSVLSNDVLWLSISLAFFLASVLFYFQVLQPLVLDKYSESAQSQSSLAYQNYITKINDITLAKQDIGTHLARLNVDPCTEDAKYGQAQTDTKSLQKIKDGLVVDKNFNKIPDFYRFSNQEIKDAYSAFPAQYSSALNSLKPTISDTQNTINLEDYKNEWITSCLNIEKSAGNVADLQLICKNLKEKTTIYIKTASQKTLDSLKTPLANLDSSCTDISASTAAFLPNYFQFKLKWLVDFDTVYKTTVSPVTDLTENNTKLFETQVTTNQQKIQKIVSDKSGITNIWYLLNFRF